MWHSSEKWQILYLFLFLGLTFNSLQLLKDLLLRTSSNKILQEASCESPDTRNFIKKPKRPAVRQYLLISTKERPGTNTGLLQHPFGTQADVLLVAAPLVLHVKVQAAMSRGLPHCSPGCEAVTKWRVSWCPKLPPPLGSRGHLAKTCNFLQLKSHHWGLLGTHPLTRSKSFPA